MRKWFSQTYANWLHSAFVLRLSCICIWPKLYKGQHRNPPRVVMTNTTLDLNARLKKSLGREKRDQTIQTRFTKSEVAEMLEAAETSRQTLSEWVRTVLVREAHGDAIARATFTELIAARMVLTDLLAAIAVGQKIMTPDQLTKIIHDNKAAKHSKAAELLQLYGNPLRDTE